MSLRRQRTESTQIERQRSVRNIAQQNPHFFQIQRRKYKPASGNVYSLHSIDTKRSSINLYNNSKMKNNHRRRQLSIPVNQPKHLLTERPERSDIHNKPLGENKVNLMPVKQKWERVHTIEDERLGEKEKRIKNCIQLMCRVLQEIKNQKETNRVSKTKIIDEFAHIPQENVKKTEQNAQSKFQSYVKNITKLKESNKIILIKRGKSKSIINNENIHSSNLSNGKSFISKDISPITQQAEAIPSRTNASKPTVQKQSKTPINLEEISCSSIEKGNQSSFVSELSRQSFMRNLIEEEGKAEEKQQQSRRVVKFKNSKQLKQMFPIDFF